ncbi:MAG: 50S ribosomal protein L6 [Rhabdochlamydiaceae bacterium]|jgi:large subunit ribosomal protein L6|nr:50S ribosomal protein L6 [Rhabdochlamydiaceae bacterium]
MSRLGKIAIEVPSGVEVKLVGRKLIVKGPKGELAAEFPEGLSIKIENGQALVMRDEASDLNNAIYGLHRSLFNNMIVGVSKGFEIKLSMVGVGYRAALEGHNLNLQIGKSHPTKLAIPKGVTITIDKAGVISITGIDKHLVGQFAASVRAEKPPEPYKGKGIRYENEYVRKKAGKAAKAKTAAG